MTTKTLIKGVRLIGEETADILVDGDKIADVGQLGLVPEAETVQADGLVALPSFVDIHTHLREPGREDTETIATGSAAAAMGGFSAVLAMANTSPVTDTAELAESMFDTGRRVGHADVIPVGAVSKGLKGEELAELGLMNRSRAKVHVFSDDGLCVADSQLMRRALEYIRAFDGVISQHAQDPRLAGKASCCHEGPISGQTGLPGWPGVAEDVIVARDVQLARHTGSRVHVAHMSTAESVEIVRWAKSRGINITCEVAPHHLLLPVELVEGYDSTYKVNPPLRPAEDREALFAAVLDGTIDAIATDHAPHARHDKEHPFVDAAFGMLGLETSFASIHSLFVEPGHMSWQRLVELMSTNPARIAKLHDHGQTLATGNPANIVLVDPASAWQVNRDDSVSLSRNNPWHGHDFTGQIHSTMWNGRFTVADGKLTQPISGQPTNSH